VIPILVNAHFSLSLLFSPILHSHSLLLLPSLFLPPLPPFDFPSILLSSLCHFGSSSSSSSSSSFHQSTRKSGKQLPNSPYPPPYPPPHCGVNPKDDATLRPGDQHDLCDCVRCVGGSGDSLDDLAAEQGADQVTRVAPDGGPRPHGDRRDSTAGCRPGDHPLRG